MRSCSARVAVEKCGGAGSAVVASMAVGGAAMACGEQCPSFYRGKGRRGVRLRP
jgi:hypothetical protein